MQDQKAKHLIIALLRKAKETRNENRANETLSECFVFHNSGKAAGFEIAAKLIADAYGLPFSEYCQGITEDSAKDLET